MTVQGRDDNANEPARHAHCDMIMDSLRDTIRVCRQDIREMAGPSIEAEETRFNGTKNRVPRYAAYSVWVCLTLSMQMTVAELCSSDLSRRSDVIQ